MRLWLEEKLREALYYLFGFGRVRDMTELRKKGLDMGYHSGLDRTEDKIHSFL